MAFLLLALQTQPNPNPSQDNLKNVKHMKHFTF